MIFGSRLWNRENGYRQILVIAIPLVLSTSSWALQHFVDRMFLSWYSDEALAAALPAGILSFTTVSIFMGTASYVNTFVAQYYGAGQYEKIGPIVWQGVYFSLICGSVLLVLVPMAGPIFHLVGHNQALQEQEVVYFRILCIGSVAPITGAALAGFFSGRGQPWTIVWVNCLAAPVNLVLNYVLIFGHWGFPELGIAGAAIATTVNGFAVMFTYLILFLRGTNRLTYHTVNGYRYHRLLFWRLLRFGLPDGIQLFCDMAGFTIFVLLIGRLGTTHLAATNIVFNVNMLTFVPMMGVGIAVTVLVGQSMGKNQPDLAARAVFGAAQLGVFYTFVMAILFVLLPNIFIYPFAAQADPERFEEIRTLALFSMRFIAAFCIFDSLAIIFAAGLKGAGDTRFTMFSIIITSLFVLVIPSYLSSTFFQAGIFVLWSIICVYIGVLCVIFILRFLDGKWKFIRLIDKPENPESMTIGKGLTIH